MQKLGNWTTIDCPKINVAEALYFLETKLHPIGITIRQIENDHEMGIYPSFEIDIPEELANFSDDDFDFYTEDKYNELQKTKEVLIEKYEKVEAEYREKYKDSL